jgi:hypothetical protein
MLPKWTKKEKDDQWQRYKHDEPKKAEQCLKEDAIKFWNLFASLLEWRVKSEFKRQTENKTIKQESKKYNKKIGCIYNRWSKTIPN